MRKSIQPDKIESIALKFPDLNVGWLMTGEGEMLKETTAQKVTAGRDISGAVFQGSATVGRDVHLHSNGGKDMVIEKQEEQVSKSYDVLVSELQRFHDANMVKDEYITKQDTYISTLVRESYHRNERNMERIDKAMEQQSNIMEQQNKVIEQQNELIKIVGI